MSVTWLLLGAALAVAIAAAAYRLGALSAGGAAGAVLVGTLTFGIGGLAPAVLLILFFVSSSGLSRLGKTRKRSLAATFSKGSRRDLGQVVANGAVAAALSVVYGLGRDPIWLAGVAGALAAALLFAWLRPSTSLPAAAAASILLVSSPIFHRVSRMCLTDALLALGLIGALCAVARDPRLARRRSLWTFSACSAAAILVKGVAGLLPLLILALFAVLNRRGERPDAQRIAQAVLLTAALA